MTSIFNQSGYRAVCLRYMIWHMTHFNQSNCFNVPTFEESFELFMLDF